MQMFHISGTYKSSSPPMLSFSGRFSVVISPLKESGEMEAIKPPAFFTCNSTAPDEVDHGLPSSDSSEGVKHARVSIQLVPVSFRDERSAIARRKRRMARQRRSVDSISKLPPLPPNLCFQHSPSRAAVEMGLRFLLQKELRNSDVGSLGRIVIPKREAEQNLPVLSVKEGLFLTMEELETMHIWTFKYRFWPNNKSRMYILEQTGEFVRTRHLRPGDVIMIFKNDKTQNYVIHSKKTMAVRQIIPSKRVTVHVGVQVATPRKIIDFVGSSFKEIDQEGLSRTKVACAFPSKMMKFKTEMDTTDLEKNTAGVRIDCVSSSARAVDKVISPGVDGKSLMSQTGSSTVDTVNDSVEYNLVNAMTDFTPAGISASSCALPSPIQNIAPKQFATQPVSWNNAMNYSSQWDAVSSRVSHVIQSDTLGMGPHVSAAAALLNHKASSAGNRMSNDVARSSSPVRHLIEHMSTSGLPLMKRTPLLSSSVTVANGPVASTAAEYLGSLTDLCAVGNTKDNCVADSLSRTAVNSSSSATSDSSLMGVSTNNMTAFESDCVKKHIWEAEVNSLTYAHGGLPFTDIGMVRDSGDYSFAADVTFDFWCSVHGSSPWLQTAPAIAYDALSLDDF